jgi:hypothetical protein
MLGSIAVGFRRDQLGRNSHLEPVGSSTGRVRGSVGHNYRMLWSTSRQHCRRNSRARTRIMGYRWPYTSYLYLAKPCILLNLEPHFIGQQCVDLLREELEPTNADMHVPLVKGGVQLHKLQGVMHDTCNTANKTARLAKALRDTSGQLYYYGYDNCWELLVKDDKPWFDFLCGNHTNKIYPWMPPTR